MIQVTLTETAANKVKELIQRSDPETGQPLGSIEDTYLRMYVAWTTPKASRGAASS